jgi:CBS domain containing-hemolysin-like protein
MILLIIYGGLAIAVSFLCSMLEAGLLSLPRSHVAAMVERRSRAGLMLQSMKDNIDRPLAAILTLNTIAHTVGAAGVGAQAAVVFGDAGVGVAGAVMTLAILVFSEIIPKTLGVVHARALAGVTAMTTRAMMVLCLPITVVLQWINRLIGYQRRKDRTTRLEVLTTVKLAREGGSLDARQHRIMSNVLSLDRISLAKVLTPRTVLFSLPQTMTARQASSQHDPIRFARIPVYAETSDHVTGYVPRFEIHRAIDAGRGDEPLAKLAKPIINIPELATVADALDQMLKEGQHIALVVDEYGGTEGIVTLEDLFETLLGQEIVDETDAVIDMQALARKRASRKGQ